MDDAPGVQVLNAQDDLCHQATDEVLPKSSILLQHAVNRVVIDHRRDDLGLAFVVFINVAYMGVVTLNVPCDASTRHILHKNVEVMWIMRCTDITNNVPMMQVFHHGNLLFQLRHLHFFSRVRIDG